jgi:glycine hydroxymethyltransferase
MLIDLNNKNLTGKEAEKALEDAGITVNKNTVPFETRSPFVTSGIRIGVPAVTTKGMREPDMEEIAGLIDHAIQNRDNERAIRQVKEEVSDLCKRFPLYLKGVKPKSV